ncbi:MAG: 3-hydroxyacyl-CoA dehydrogenase/enoyl-CoA hydratase family protein [Candidatus Marinimicrobia bacterium]|jgi:3-hydroxyacyl-CoA dehydrogenase|nr:3-hydroxyacyl-CoA dehydrogenase/enoyl-CoA hydratase family protein [Candidatus Neomarinimicrobiota bacterium]MBT3618747.1 3-hydroxyacyl-CoA dehydrogenase/enoyl-CoA hydratase family protein [Candidatus Neomarinimicrobiota bacterium]MBT3828314.1 3-hydroxyacyl-CoA dehydrogenase/enoyl-CoA hydratase family protein [Candidatus Neomarinimicrobiota bacterium]MBT3997225.1 3-hydroxyacyl-CoA dehydrogenase/enoyl-CoA hydratase family protein [Candidatus Neomarinimicrobiota bacterium]MBT4280177.1 3-hydrox
MSHHIEKVAVLGAGVMGSQIAGHLANAGIPSFLFDINQNLSEKGIETLTKLKPAPLFKPKNVELITPCNYDNHIEKINEVDWVLEAVSERLDIKHSVYKNITPQLKSTAIVTSNTSGIPLLELITVFPNDVKSRFMITHFFNPPRYMHLLELVRSEFTSENVYNSMAEFGEDVMGKGIVHAKDTPNFIGNRIGVFNMGVTIHTALQQGLTVEEVDKLTGTIVGRPKSATFRTADVVGLDTMAHVTNTTYEKVVDDNEREIFKIPEILQTLVDDGRLGQKTKAGFYKKTDEGILSIDLKTGEYSPQKRVRFDGFRLAKDHTVTGGKIKALAFSEDKAGKFFWETLARGLIYSANRIPEISDDIVNIDNAIKWGFGWELGPFEGWDAIGVQDSVDKMQAEKRDVPKWILDMLASGRTCFYETKDGVKTYWDVLSGKAIPIPTAEKEINLNLRKSGGNLIKQNWSASLIDLGEGVLNVEFHSILQPTLNPIDGSLAMTINEGMDLLEAGKFKAMVIGHTNQNFCAGANLASILEVCEAKEWDTLEGVVKDLQDLTQRIRFSKAPVVAAPFNLALGGGFELIGPAAHRVAAAELYVGLVEVGVGLIPGAGGNLRLLLNMMENGGKSRINTFQIAQKAFETIGFAKVATSADEAKYIGYLLKTDTIVLNNDHRIWKAKQKALELAKGYEPPQYRDDLKLPGTGGRTAMAIALKGFKAQGKISDHDEFIAKKLAYVLTGGDKGGLTKAVDEQYLLDIEREAFVSLAGEKLTQNRIRFMLKKGKPLRN